MTFFKKVVNMVTQSSSSSSSLDLEKIQFKGPRPFTDSITSLNTSSAPISPLDSTASITNESCLRYETELVLKRNSTQKEDGTKVNCWKFGCEAHASNTERKTCCIFCCCICYK